MKPTKDCICTGSTMICHEWTAIPAKKAIFLDSSSHMSITVESAVNVVSIRHISNNIINLIPQNSYFKYIHIESGKGANSSFL